VGVAIAAVGVVAWETWEARIGNDRPALKVAIGIMLSFLGGMGVERGIGFFRSGASTRMWVIDVIAGLASLVMSIFYILRRKAPKSIVEWLNERAKPPLVFDKKDD
jgi:hypothetical protein